MSKKIVINIDSEGNIDAETFDFKGISCSEQLDKLFKDIANNPKRTKKKDYYQEDNIIVTKPKITNEH
jgi:hypothetical protein